MAQAISQLQSNDGSYIGAYMSQLMGLEISKSGVRKGNSFKPLIQEYQLKVIKRAMSKPEWEPYAPYIKVKINDKNNIIVFIDGPVEIIEEANLIEFGDGATPANPLLRTSEAEFNSDFGWRKMGTT